MLNGNVPREGTVLWITSIGAGHVDLANQNAGSTDRKRIITTAAATISLAAGSGRASLVYDGNTSRWRVLEHEQGAWIAVPYASGNFTGSGAMTWTVDAGDVLCFRYWLKGCTVTLNVAIVNSTVGGTPDSFLQVNQLATYAGSQSIASGAWYKDNGTFGTGTVQSNGATLQVAKTAGANWTASTNLTQVAFTIPF